MTPSEQQEAIKQEIGKFHSTEMLNITSGLIFGVWEIFKSRNPQASFEDWFQGWKERRSRIESETPHHSALSKEEVRNLTMDYQVSKWREYYRATGN